MSQTPFVNRAFNIVTIMKPAWASWFFYLCIAIIATF